MGLVDKGHDELRAEALSHVVVEYAWNSEELDRMQLSTKP